MFSHLRLQGEWFEPESELINFIKEINLKSLEGKFFHFFKDNKVEWQGYIVSEPKDGYFIIQLFDWILGYPSNQKLIKIDDMIGWNLYDTDEEMNEAYYSKYH